MSSSIEKYYEISSKDILRDKALKHGAWLAPIGLSFIPALIAFIPGFLTANAFLIFLSIILFIGGFILGLLASGGLMLYRANWLTKIRERLAIDGIKASELNWFMNELSSQEKKSLKSLEASDLLLADAYRETLASRLTATRIVKSSKQELLLIKRRETKLKQLKGETSAAVLADLEKDRRNLDKIHKEAAEMRIEAETRLQMIEAAAHRGGNVADTEIALKKLTARSEQLPLALEALKMEEEMRRELEAAD